MEGWVGGGYREEEEEGGVVEEGGKRRGQRWGLPPCPGPVGRR